MRQTGRPIQAGGLAVLVSAAVLLVPAAPGRSSEPPNPPGLSELVGTWRVDLRPTPEASPYYQELVISVSGDTVEGTFYGSPFRDLQLNADWGTLHFAFVTDDGSGAYNTTARLLDGRLEGTTHSLGRGFLAVWTAEREKAGAE